MTRDEAESELRVAGEADDAAFPLLAAAVACAVHDVPFRDTAPVHALAERACERLCERAASEPPEEALAESLCGDLRLNGDLLHHDDPANTDVIDVADRRRGLSATLAVFYIHAARTCRLPADGVDFPGHFLLRVQTGEGPVAIDPFSEGRLVLPSELTRRALLAGLMPDIADRLDVLMAPVSDRKLLIRLQNLLFARAIRARDFACAERSAVRRALLDPGDHRPWLDVAQAREKQGAIAGALQALDRARELDSGAALHAARHQDRLRMQLN